MSIQYFYFHTAYFLLYSFLGWCLEVAFHALCKGAIVNRGFLNGPVCPIYGFGMLSVLTILKPFMHNTLLLFICGTAFATFIELIGGFALFQIFKMRWWDYSNEPFNLGGYICARFSIAWGLCILFAVHIVHPIVELNVYLLDRPVGYIIVFLCYCLFTADCIITVLTIAKLNKKLRLLNTLGTRLRSFSDDLTEKISTSSIEAGTKLQEGRVQAALAKADVRDDLIKLREQAALARTDAEEQMLRLREQLAEHRHYSYGRLLRAFPALTHSQYDEELHSIIDRMKEKRAALLKACDEQRSNNSKA